jgi:hypothetical protein
MNVGLYMKGRNRLKVFKDTVLRERFRVKRGYIHTYIYSLDIYIYFIVTTGCGTSHKYSNINNVYNTQTLYTFYKTIIQITFTHEKFTY